MFNKIYLIHFNRLSSRPRVTILALIVALLCTHSARAVIYGDTDDRANPVDSPIQEARELAENVVLISDSIPPEKAILEHYKGYCSGTVIRSPRGYLVKTAGHCLPPVGESCDHIYFTRNLEKYSSKPLITHHCQKVLLSSTEGVDIGLAEISEAINSGRKLSELPSLTLNLAKSVEVGTPLIVIGHQEGGPKKIVDNCSVLEVNQKTGSFEADCDLSEGNSGSLTLNAHTFEVVGLYLQGPSPGRVNGRERVTRADKNTGLFVFAPAYASVLNEYFTTEKWPATYWLETAANEQQGASVYGDFKIMLPANNLQLNIFTDKLLKRLRQERISAWSLGFKYLNFKLQQDLKVFSAVDVKSSPPFGFHVRRGHRMPEGGHLFISYSPGMALSFLFGSIIDQHVELAIEKIKQLIDPRIAQLENSRQIGSYKVACELADIDQCLKQLEALNRVLPNIAIKTRFPFKEISLVTFHGVSPEVLFLKGEITEQSLTELLGNREKQLLTNEQRAQQGLDPKMDISNHINDIILLSDNAADPMEEPIIEPLRKVLQRHPEFDNASICRSIIISKDQCHHLCCIQKDSSEKQIERHLKSIFDPQHYRKRFRD